MANPFFTNLLDLISGNRARASEVEANLSAVEAGFDGVYEYLTRALRGPQAGATIAELPSAASRANKVLVFDASGNPAVATPTDSMNAVNRAGDIMTAPLAQAAGTAALPSYTFTGSTSTGIYSPGANRMGIATAGVQRVEVDAAGNVGLGTAAPAYQLHQEAAAGTYHLLKSGNAAIVGVLFGDTDSNVVGRIQYDHATNTMQFFSNGSEVFRSTALGLTVSNGGGLGYGTGSGGTVTQPTSKSTTVTLNKPSGQITMNAAALAAATSVQFQVNNTSAAGADGVVLNITGGTANASSYRVAGYVQGSAFLIRLTNESGGSLSDAVVINFGLFKVATS